MSQSVMVARLDAGQDLLHEFEVANREHEQAFGAASAMVQHAINAGEALLAAKARVAGGEWTRVLADRFVGSPETARVYMQMADAQDVILGNPEVKSISQARRYLREIGSVREPHGSHGRGVYISGTVREEARALRREGLTYDEIATTLGHSRSSVYSWCNPSPNHAARRARSKTLRREARRAVERERRAKAVEALGGSSEAEIYSVLRKLAQQVDRAIDKADDRERRAALSTALTKIHAAEDQIVRALGLS